MTTTYSRRAMTDSLMQPGPHHRHLDAFVGTWRATVSVWQSPGADPLVSEGTMVNAWVLGGRFLEQRYQGEAFGGAFQGHGYWGFNNGARQYEGFWIDTASTVMQKEAGSYDPTTKTFTMEGSFPNPTTGAPMTRRTVISVVSEDEHRMEVAFPGPDDTLYKTMEVVYRRA